MTKKANSVRTSGFKDQCMEYYHLTHGKSWIVFHLP